MADHDVFKSPRRLRTSPTLSSTKAPTGITGFDQTTGGPLPRLMRRARDCKEPGNFVAFEDTAERLLANAKAFG